MNIRLANLIGGVNMTMLLFYPVMYTIVIMALRESRIPNENNMMFEKLYF